MLHIVSCPILNIVIRNRLIASHIITLTQICDTRCDAKCLIINTCILEVTITIVILHISICVVITSKFASLLQIILVKVVCYLTILEVISSIAYHGFSVYVIYLQTIALETAVILTGVIIGNLAAYNTKVIDVSTVFLEQLTSSNHIAITMQRACKFIRNNIALRNCQIIEQYKLSISTMR